MMNSNRVNLLCCLGASAAITANAKVEIDAMKHDIQLITAGNFDSVIGKFRDSAVSSLWFFNDDVKEDQQVLDSYNKVASELKGMAKICAISCTEFPQFCKKNNIVETPSIMLYPPNPVPAFKYEGKLETKAISGKISRFMADLSTKLTKDNADAWVTSDPTKPKVMLFSNKKSPPTIFKALSSETVFKRTIKFGFVADSETDVVSKFKVTKFPTLMMQRGSKAEIKETYKGAMDFLSIKEWVNLHSESGMGDKVAGAGGKEEVSMEESKPWLVQDVPELTLKSHQDICLRGEGLCVIYLKDGEATSEELDMLNGLSKKFSSQLSDRGTKMKWMWLNLAVEAAYKELFEPAALPSVVVFNPHKRLRFTKLDHGEDNEVKGDAAGISSLLDKVLGGDARFKMVPGQKMPKWVAREGAAKANEKRKEL
eukprot:TRINITY_DN389_c0_g1_i1.p1 TRINITY_DN389_c0_g1~~TRINITY_DN389_c0_g1_i1.p1  ORF type:complete len:453 (+),score=101.87 TRINITY_DN389_c0_g1_i1:83-1360(+)